MRFLVFFVALVCVACEPNDPAKPACPAAPSTIGPPVICPGAREIVYRTEDITCAWSCAQVNGVVCSEVSRTWARTDGALVREILLPDGMHVCACGP